METDEPILSVVVIARNEEAKITLCLEALLCAIEPFRGARIVVVDSDSTDNTVGLAIRYPVTVYRYRSAVLTAAAGRRIGFERVHAKYVLFVDGDCVIERAWLKHAVATLEASPTTAVIYGRRLETFDDEWGDLSRGRPPSYSYGLGGNALYRAQALRNVNSFNPFISDGEEAELLGRITKAGYQAIETSQVMFTHQTKRKDTLRGFLRRHVRNPNRGYGRVLRLAVGQGLLRYHVSQKNRYLLLLAHLAVGLMLAAASVVFSTPVPITVWAALSVLLFMILWYRRGSLRSAIYIVSEWIIVAIFIPIDFLKKPCPPDSFAYSLERVK